MSAPLASSVGLLTQRSTSTVNRDKVYGPGWHQVGPDYEFKVFQTSLINFESSLSVWTKSGGDDAGAVTTTWALGRRVNKRTRHRFTKAFDHKWMVAEPGGLFGKVSMCGFGKGKRSFFEGGPPKFFQSGHGLGKSEVDELVPRMVKRPKGCGEGLRFGDVPG